jgi:hypothetical protein
MLALHGTDFTNTRLREEAAKVRAAHGPKAVLETPHSMRWRDEAKSGKSAKRLEREVFSVA